MSRERNLAAVRRLLGDVLNGGDLDAIGELVHPDYVDRAGGGPGPDGYRRWAAGVWAAFPDFELTIEDLLADGDRVVVRYTARGTHRGEVLRVPPTGRRVEYMGIGIVRLADGRMIERWNCSDTMCLLAQLGALPPELT